jgi:site-specific DNA-methyltransferase (cytosine-N4-specific)
MGDFIMLLPKEEILNVILHAQDTTYLTHNFHPFPGKFIPQIPNFFIKHLSNRNDLILDPYCGSGTTLVESKLLGRRSLGLDIHPLGVFMANVKATKITDKELDRVPALLAKIEKRLDNFWASRYKNQNLMAFMDNSFENGAYSFDIPDFPNRDHWFEEPVLHELAIIKTSIIQECAGEEFKNFVLLAFSSIIVSVSNQESETRYAAVKKETLPKHAFSLFKNKLLDMSRRMKEFNKRASDCQATAHHADCREVDFLEENSADLIVTSPPYPNTYDYYLYHKLRMFWLDLDWERAKFNEIGSRLRHSSQRENIDTYIMDMTRCFERFRHVLKPNKPFVIVVGDSIIRKELFRGDEVINEIAEKTGFKLLDKVNYSLNYASKSFNPAFRNKTKEEHIILLNNEK